jgi:hypothetical protein
VGVFLALLFAKLPFGAGVEMGFPEDARAMALKGSKISLAPLLIAYLGLFFLHK